MSKRKDSFLKLVETKQVLIPVIQRDYAQGREDGSARRVRERLIDDWMKVLTGIEPTMDFNYVYGVSEGEYFYPVDGQQRLTSLFLMHWYLAHRTGRAERISQWNFDYETRNSSSEFFEYMKRPKDSRKLYEILSRGGGMESIKNQVWFKGKWENDPTVMSCLRFLVELSIRFQKEAPETEETKEKYYHKLWHSLTGESGDGEQEAQEPSIYFTCLEERMDDRGQVEAARKYTRMNARGKKLTDFENLKAMIDEIEQSNLSSLAYLGGPGEQAPLLSTISYAYDSIYINYLYQKYKEKPGDGGSLREITERINRESEEWFRQIYEFYLLTLSTLQDGRSVTADEYEKEIYEISQQKGPLGSFCDYLCMVKAVLEGICHSEDGDGAPVTVAWEDLSSPGKKLALVFYFWKMWKPENTEKENGVLVQNWKDFWEALVDLDFTKWQCTDAEKAQILIRLLDGLDHGDLNRYFVEHDFIRDNVFALSGKELLPDIGCRVLARKVRSKLSLDAPEHREKLAEILNAVRILGNRWAYFFDACDCFAEVSYLADDWSAKGSWSAASGGGQISIVEKVMRRGELIRRGAKDAGDFAEQCAKAGLFAYAAECEDTLHLKGADEIDHKNTPDQIWKDHIWDPQILYWKDRELELLRTAATGTTAGSVSKDENLVCWDLKRRHFRRMLLLLEQYQAQGTADQSGIVEGFAGHLKEQFAKPQGYERCWVRLAVCYGSGSGRDLLETPMVYHNGEVCFKEDENKYVPVLLKVYLKGKGYDYQKMLSNYALKYLGRSCWYQSGNEVVYAISNKEKCTFEVGQKYVHSTGKAGRNLPEAYMKRNMDLQYGQKFAWGNFALTQSFASIEKVQKEYVIKKYRIAGTTGDGKMEIAISETKIPDTVENALQQRMWDWETELKNILDSPTSQGNYDKWLDLWFDPKTYQFMNGNLANGIPLPGGRVDPYSMKIETGRRPGRIWVERFELQNPNWTTRTDSI